MQSPSVRESTRPWPRVIAASLAPFAPARPARLRLERPALSITFDGFGHSAATTGAALLEAHGLRGTYFAAAALAGAQGPDEAYFLPEEMIALAQAGHEIGNAGYTFSDLSALAPPDAVSQLDRNAATLAVMGVRTPCLSAAYPEGRATPSLKLALARRGYVARTRSPGLNGRWSDLTALSSFPLHGAETFAPIADALDRARRLRAWVIVHTQDVRDKPSRHGVTPATLDALINVAKRAGFDIQPVGHVAERALGAAFASRALS